MSYTGDVRRALRAYQRQEEGNWRLKGLMLGALSGDFESVGKEWPTNDRFLSEAHKSRSLTAMGQTVDPSALPEDSHERSLARADKVISRHMDDGTPMDKDAYIKRALLSDSGSELDILWREELVSTVVDGAKPMQVARDIVGTMPVSKKKGDIPRGSAYGFAKRYAEGAEIEMDREDFDTAPYAAERYAQGFAITEALIEEAEPDVLERQVRFAGEAMENAVNRKWLTTVLDDAGNTTDADVGGTLDLSGSQALNYVQTEVALDNFAPGNKVVAHPEFMRALFADTNLAYANRYSDSGPIQRRVFNEVMGVTLYESSDNVYDPDGSATWGYDADGEIGAVLVSDKHSEIVMWKDMEMKDFEDPIRDLVGGNVRSYFDVVTTQADAHGKVQY